MEHPVRTTCIVPKEDVASLTFPDGNVFDNQADKKILEAALHRAIILGNTQKRKVKIYFEDSDGLKMTETTIWAVTEKNILLKKGVSIPKRRIVKISAY